MLTSLLRRSSGLGLLLVAAACGDDDTTPLGDGGSGGATSASTGTGATSSTTTSSHGGGGADQGGGGAEQGAGGEAQGAGGEAGGGGTAATPHPVELALEVRPEGSDPDGMVVLLNDEDGGLVDRFDGSELPITVDVVDGQTITYVDVGRSTMMSHRVTPELTRVVRPLLGSFVGPSCEPGGTMPITVTIPEVPGAAVYEVQTGHAPRVQTTAPGPVVIDLEACTSVQTFDLVATASTSDGQVLAMEVRDVAYVPDQPLALELTLPPPQRDPIAIAISSVEGMDRVFGYGQWVTTGDVYLSILDAGIALDVIPTSDTIDYAAAVVSPGFGVPIVQVHARRAPEGDSCIRSQIFHVGATDETLHFDARGLRAPTLVGATGWAWADEGEHGSIVYREFKHRVGDRWWSLFEDPRRAAGPAVFPEMPEDLAGLTPTDGLDLRTIGHYALEGTPDYATYLATDDQTPLETTSRATTWRRCDD